MYDLLSLFYPLPALYSCSAAAIVQQVHRVSVSLKVLVFLNTTLGTIVMKFRAAAGDEPQQQENFDQQERANDHVAGDFRKPWKLPQRTNRKKRKQHHQ